MASPFKLELRPAKTLPLASMVSRLRTWGLLTSMIMVAGDDSDDYWAADIDLVSDPSAALAKISNAIEQVAGDRAEYGALQNRLEYTVSNLMNVAEFTTAARSRIEDADFAAESARLAKAQVLQQTGTAMLAQANVIAASFVAR